MGLFREFNEAHGYYSFSNIRDMLKAFIDKRSYINNRDKKAFPKAITVDCSSDYKNLLVCMIDYHDEMYSFDLKTSDDSSVHKFMNYYNEYTENNTRGRMMKSLALESYYCQYIE